MHRILIGGVAALLMTGGGLLVRQGMANQPSIIPAPPSPAVISDELPRAGADATVCGPAPPTPPEVPKASREEVRFNRYDRNRDELVSRLEMMSSQTMAFKTLDTDSNNLLMFEEWAAANRQRFTSAGGHENQLLTRKEFARGRSKTVAKPRVPLLGGDGLGDDPAV